MAAYADIFSDWIYKAFPDRADKVLNMIKSCHDGNLNDSDFGRRMSGEGKVAESIHQMFRMACNRFWMAVRCRSMTIAYLYREREADEYVLILIFHLNRIC
jgi:DNA repair photolyase